MSTFMNSTQKLNQLPEKARQFAMRSATRYRTAQFSSKIACHRTEWLGFRFLFLPAYSIYFFRKKSTFGLKKRLLFTAILSWDDRIRRYFRLRPVSSIRGVFVRCRRHPCRLFLPVRSALAPLRILIYSVLIKFLLNKKGLPFAEVLSWDDRIRTCGMTAPKAVVLPLDDVPKYMQKTG